MPEPSQFVRKAEYARMHGWDRSYVSKLQGEGRVVLSEDGKLVDWARTDALIGKTADPSKLGVKERWQNERAEQVVYEHMHSPALDSKPSSAAPAPTSDSAFHQARASREHYTGQMARLEYEWVTGLLVSRLRVEDAAHTLGRSLRDQVLGLVPRISPELAAISDAWELEKKLVSALRQVLDDVVGDIGQGAMRDINNDPARGKLSELAREGRERYGSERDDTAAP